MLRHYSIEDLLKQDRLIVLVVLVLITVLSWLYIVYLYYNMVYMDMNALLFAMPMTPTWSATDFVLLSLMWLVMMVGMMTPSVTPLVTTFAKINRQRRQHHQPFINTAYLLAGYFIVWSVFSVVATLLQWWLQQVALLNPGMKTTSHVLGGIIFLSAGLFQFTPLKQTCLTHCRTPVNFLLLHWKEGKQGALKMGIENGCYCLGCCWLLMVLLFAAGIMNLLWIAIIAAFVFVEKLTPSVKWIPYSAGLFLMVYGVLLIANYHLPV